MMSGIYCYKDTLNNNEIVYIGKDSNISENRRKIAHMMPSAYNAQQINRVLQNNIGRYKYCILKSWETLKHNPKLINALEILYIKRYNPKFNFTKGGEGVFGFKHSEKTKRKISEKLTGRKLSNESRKKISESLKGRTLSDESKNKIRDATKQYMSVKEHRDNVSKHMKGKNNHRWKDYPRILKDGHKHGKQNYCIRYNGKRIYSSINYDKIIEKLEALENEIAENKIK